MELPDAKLYPDYYVEVSNFVLFGRLESKTNELLLLVDQGTHRV